jgi:thiamine biosynthesis protein ThiI
MIARVGVAPIFVYFDAYPLVDARAKEIALEVIRKVAAAFPYMRLKGYVIPHRGILQKILESCPANLHCLISRRMMLRVAEQIAKREGADGIVLGDVLGQKASQTLMNLTVTDTAVSSVPILRPLLGLNKTEIEMIARRIGTFEISTRPGVCTCGVETRKPRTKATREEIDEAEKQLDIEELVNAALIESEELFFNE